MSSPVSAASTPAHASRALNPQLMVGALGVVFGDIGTSPIYAFRESLKAAGGATQEMIVLGVLSLLFWALILIVAVKYVLFVMRADNHGEGGTMALLSLALPASGKLERIVLVTGLAGASLFFGDAMITPAISVLSAVEGINVSTPLFQSYVVPLAVAILVALFAIQNYGSGRVGRLFGPLMICWFALIAIAGANQVLSHPQIVKAFDPRYAIAYIRVADGWAAFTVLGSVFLALTGGEALYADMGHFGRPAIRIDWFIIVMPALMLNYLGQGALVLSEPNTTANPFFLLFPAWGLFPVVAITTAATIIASQAVISGAFALVQQAIQLGALPRLDVRQTSDEQIGQVYVPQINWLLAVAVIGLVLGFRSSDALANAYGIAVAGDMLVTTVLVSVVALGVWGWPTAAVVVVGGFFLILDVTFVSANVHKIPAGGWFPLVVGGLALTLMFSWVRGRAVALKRREEGAVSIEEFVQRMGSYQRVAGVAIYLTTRADAMPSALALNLKHNRVLHDLVVILKIVTERSPRVAEGEHVLVETLSTGLLHITIHFGFAEKPDVPAALEAHAHETGFAASDASFFLGREVPVPSLRPEIRVWQEKLYAFMTRNAVSAPDYFLIPPLQVIQLGTKVEL